MCQTGCTYYGTYLLNERILQFRPLLDDTSGNVAVSYTHLAQYVEDRVYEL